MVTLQHWAVAAAQLITLLMALGCSVYLFSVRPDKRWYAGRAVAESVKTITWRFVSRAEPFQHSDEKALQSFKLALRDIVNQNKEVCQTLTHDLDGDQITPAMLSMRSKTLDERKIVYSRDRISDQHKWYAGKARFNRERSDQFFWLLIFINTIAVIFGVMKVGNSDLQYWPTDVLVAAAASVLTWTQTKRFSELAASYALASHEIGLIKDDLKKATTADAFSVFVGDAENAFSREHTQWAARKDV